MYGIIYQNAKGLSMSVILQKYFLELKPYSL